MTVFVCVFKYWFFYRSILCHESEIDLESALTVLCIHNFQWKFYLWIGSCRIWIEWFWFEFWTSIWLLNLKATSSIWKKGTLISDAAELMLQIFVHKCLFEIAYKIAKFSAFLCNMKKQQLTIVNNSQLNRGDENYFLKI